MSLFTGIENNISICYKFQNDFNDYFQDKNNKNINDFTNGNSGNFNDDIKIKKNSNGNFNKNNNENKDISNINFNNCKGIFIDSNYDDYFL